MYKAVSDKTTYKCATLHENGVLNVNVSLKSLLIFTCLGGNTAIPPFIWQYGGFKYTFNKLETQ
jgi:hypothetical protein